MREFAVGASPEEPPSREDLRKTSAALRTVPASGTQAALSGGAEDGEDLGGWLRQHLADIAELAGPASLGIVCARLGVAFAEVAPPHLPLSERAERLLAYLASRTHHFLHVEIQPETHPGAESGAQHSGHGSRSGRVQARPEQELSEHAQRLEPPRQPRNRKESADDAQVGFRALASALLTDEATAAAAAERGLPALLAKEQPLAPPEGAAAAVACICQPLPPPPAWLGRDAELGALDAHLRTGARIVFLRGEPGAGKSALLGRWLRELLIASAAQAHPFHRTGATAAAGWQEAGFSSVFYWSFTHDPDVHAFLRTAADYVCGADPEAPGKGTAGRDQTSAAALAQWTGAEAACRYHLDRLLTGLAEKNAPALLVLDGLERMQRHWPPKQSSLAPSPADLHQADDSRRGTKEGELAEPHLASLLLALTLGTANGVAVATIYTTIPALRPWLGSRCIEVELLPLTPAEGAELLRYSGIVGGAESDLEHRSIEHSGHALTLYLLGRYLHAYFEGDGRAVTRSELPATDTGLNHSDLSGLQDRTSLRQVLRAHLLALPEPARRLLDLCVLLPGPLSISALQALLEQLEHSEEARRSAAGLSSGVWSASLSPEARFRSPPSPEVLLPDPTWLQGPAGLVERLSELEKLGLLHIATMPDGDEGIEIHPLVREPIYREWLAGRGGFFLAPRFEIDTPVGYMPRGEQGLELLERLIGLLLAAKQPGPAYAVLEQRLGGYMHHVHSLGRARRFLPIVRQLYLAVAGIALYDMLWQRRYSRLLTWEAEALRVLGQLEAALVTAQRQWPLGSAPLPRRLSQQARVYRALGRLGQAAALATAARQSICSPFDGVLIALELSNIYLLSGDPAMCQVQLLDAGALLREEQAQLTGEAESLDLPSWLKRAWALRALYLGHNERARKLLLDCCSYAVERHSELDGAQCEVLLAELLRRERSYEAAGQALHRALAAAGRSGDVETLISGGLAQGRLRLDTGHLDAAAAALGPTLALANEHGFGTYRIDLLIARGALNLRRGDFDLAERDARDALAYAAAPGCGYLWGEADALHLLATVLIASRPPPGSPRHSEAVAHLNDELDLRERMCDPTAPEVRWLLRRLKP